MEINALLKLVTDQGASDLILKVNAPPLMRLHGVWAPVTESKLGPNETLAAGKAITTPREWAQFEEDLELDLAYEVPSVARFRVNLFQQRGSVGIAWRRIPSAVPCIDDLGLPEITKTLAMRPRGLVLATGPAGCGKSTTLAAMVDWRNNHEECHIMTVEDPVEFIHKDKTGIVNQRQVGRDTLSFANGLKYVLRQDPDVILIGEMRDLETISLAITASETGHLALGTLHTTDAAATIDRIVNAFPIHQQQQVRMQLSVNLLAVVSQLLVPRQDGNGRVAAYEVLLATGAVRNAIREGKTYQIPQLMQTGANHGIISMEHSLKDLVQQGVVSPEDALAVAPRPEELQGILPKVQASRPQAYV